ncbi:unnamed protein product [Linum trigynum]|uniref:Uncharacterized protein n=1 Tax=Linum trigynum TaxID=586398 RepID=A0AAV2FR27_9ROSI
MRRFLMRILFFIFFVAFARNTATSQLPFEPGTLPLLLKLHDRLVDFEADLVTIRPPNQAPTTTFSSARGRSYGRSPGVARRNSPNYSSYGSDAYLPRDDSPRHSCGAQSHRASAGYMPGSAAPSLIGRPRLQCQFCD